MSEGWSENKKRKRTFESNGPGRDRPHFNNGPREGRPHGHNYNHNGGGGGQERRAPGNEKFGNRGPFKPGPLRKYTVSVALPSNLVASAQTPELKTMIAGHVARTLAIHNVDEVIIYDENPGSTNLAFDDTDLERERDGVRETSGVFLARMLQWLETPSYMRKLLFPMDHALRFAGLLPALEMPHHLRLEEDSPYREGLTIEPSVEFPAPQNGGTLVDAGLRRKVVIARKIKPGVRVTLQMKRVKGGRDKQYIEADVVPPSAPREKMGLYWGYGVRMATSISGVFTESAFPEGYDLTVGFSSVSSSTTPLSSAAVTSDKKEFEHLLLVFGGMGGVEAAVDADPELGLSGDDCGELFDLWVDPVPGMGVRGVRVEEVLGVGLAGLSGVVREKGKLVEVKVKGKGKGK
ncbi:hypothetical protein YB2330_005813 [Saitoella coloradoensis]